MVIWVVLWEIESGGNYYVIRRQTLMIIAASILFQNRQPVSKISNFSYLFLGIMPYAGMSGDEVVNQLRQGYRLERPSTHQGKRM